MIEPTVIYTDGRYFSTVRAGLSGPALSAALVTQTHPSPNWVVYVRDVPLERA